jgi:hypothetical protein
MTLGHRLAELTRACFSGIWIQSFEQEDAIREIAALCREEGWQLATWDIETGFSIPNSASDGAPADSDPLAAIRTAGSIGDGDTPALIVLSNFHRFLGSPEMVQAMIHQLARGKNSRCVLIVLAPVVRIPVELEKAFVVVEHNLPSRDQLETIAREIATESGELPEGGDLTCVIDAACGLTRQEAENAFSLSLVRHGQIEPASIWELKTATLKKSGLLDLHEGGEDFSSLGGLESLKAFCKRSLLRTSRSNVLLQSRGVLLLGVPGTGKSAFAKALGRETGRPTLVLDLGAMMGSLVGETEQNIRRALQIADAMAPCILFVDELEKALGGVAGPANHDSGVSARLFGTLLTWMNDHTSDVYLVATCNNISRLPPELSRAERFDAVVFLDLPGRKQKDLIWDQYIALFGLEGDQNRPDDEDWTGSEIRACCRLSGLLDIPLLQSAGNIVPIATTARESVEQLRNWASGRCLDAERGGIYQHSTANARARRSVTRAKPSNN